MIKHIWSVLCRRTIVDSATNNVTISDVLEEITIDLQIKQENLPPEQVFNLPFEFEVVSLWKKEGEKTSHFRALCEIEVLDPQGKLMKTFNQIVDLPSGMKRLRTMLKVMGFAVNKSGEYLFKINLKEEGNKGYKTVAELPFEVNLNKQFVSELPKD